MCNHTVFDATQVVLDTVEVVISEWPSGAPAAPALHTPPKTPAKRRPSDGTSATGGRCAAADLGRCGCGLLEQLAAGSDRAQHSGDCALGGERVDLMPGR